jgi:hypothetical protein
MTNKATIFYQQLLFDEFVNKYAQQIPKTRLFELSLPWLSATESLVRASNKQVIVHCLIEDKHEKPPRMLIAWPLIHINDKSSTKIQIQSLSSCYSTITEPLFFKSPEPDELSQLIFYVARENPWSTMLLGPFDDNLVSTAIDKYFPHKRLFSQHQNYYQSQLTNFNDYYVSRPSQLINTIKRRTKKLEKLKKYHVEIVTEDNAFAKAFAAYRLIYQKSWKGSELSFDFIEQVCLKAIAEQKCRLGLLWVDKQPVAAQMWFVQEDDKQYKTASIFKLAYDPDYQDFSVGSILSMALSDYVLSNDQVHCIEFGMGSEAYKKDWLGQCQYRQTYQIFNCDNIYGKLANIRFGLLPRLVNRLKRKRA